MSVISPIGGWIRSKGGVIYRAGRRTRNQPYHRIVKWQAPDTAGYQTMKDTLIETRIANVNLPRATTYYVDATLGNDSNDGLSSGAPFQTLAKVEAVIAAAPGDDADMEFLFKKDEIYYGTDWECYKNKVTLSSYGGGIGAAPPRFSTFNRQYATGGTTWTASGSAWYATEASAIAWAKFRDKDLMLTRPFAATGSVAACQALTDSFYYDSGASRLYVNVGANDPNNATYRVEATVGMNAAGQQFKFGADNLYCNGIRWEGYGLSDNGNRATYGAVFVAQNTGDEMVFQNCHFYYTGYHSLALLGEAATTGGICAFINCTAGYARTNTGTFGAVTMGVSHHAQGGQECIFQDCTLIAGNLFEASGGASGRIAQSVYAHTSGADFGLLIVDGLVCTPGPMSVAMGAGFANAPTASTLSQVRAVIEGETIIEPITGTDGATTRFVVCFIAPTNGYSARCYYQGYSHPTITFGSAGSGWTDTSYFIARTLPADGYRKFWQTAADNSRIRCCWIESGVGGVIWPNDTNSSNWPNTTIKNSVLICNWDRSDVQYAYLCHLNVNLSTALSHNCYWGVQDPNQSPYGPSAKIVAASTATGAITDAGKVVIAGGTTLNLPGSGVVAPANKPTAGSIPTGCATAGSSDRPYLDYNGVPWAGNAIGPEGS